MPRKGYDDEPAIREVVARMQADQTMSRHAAIKAVVGSNPSNVRRIEQKMTRAALAGSAKQSLLGHQSNVSPAGDDLSRDMMDERRSVASRDAKPPEWRWRHEVQWELVCLGLVVAFAASTLAVSLAVVIDAAVQHVAVFLHLALAAGVLLFARTSPRASPYAVLKVPMCIVALSPVSYLVPVLSDIVFVVSAWLAWLSLRGRGGSKPPWAPFSDVLPADGRSTGIFMFGR